MLHKIEIDTRKHHGELLNVPWGPVYPGEPLMLESAALTLEALLCPQAIIDGMTYEARMGWPEPAVHGGDVTIMHTGLTPMPATVTKTAPS